MDTTAFLDALDAAFDGDPAAGRPSDRRFLEITEQVAGFSTPGELALLNLAASLLPSGEGYLEVGTFKGRSISGAMLDAPPRSFTAVENFLEFGMVGEEARAELMRNLDAHTDAARFRLLDGDCFRVLAAPDALREPVGVYFYDGAHTGLAHYLALGVVEPLLAQEALVLVDDASWPMVEAATRRYVRRHPGWEVLRTMSAVTDHDPRWANGLMVLRYRRPAGAPRRMAGDVRWRRLAQVHLRAPLTSLVWRSLHRFPALVPLAKRVVPKRSRQVPVAQQ